MCHVGIDVGTNTTAPKILMERLGLSLNDAAFATSLYFIFRTIGCFTGSFFLRVLKTRTFFIISVICMALSMGCMWAGSDKMVLYAGIALYNQSKYEAALKEFKAYDECDDANVSAAVYGAIGDCQACLKQYEDAAKSFEKAAEKARIAEEKAAEKERLAAEKAAEKEKERKKAALTGAAKTAAGTVGRELGKTVGGAVGGKFGKTLGGNLGASLGRGILGTLFGK